MSTQLITKEQLDQGLTNPKNFREVGEKITEPINQIFEEVTEMIEKDPIMKVSNTLQIVNNEVQDLQDDYLVKPTYVKLLERIPFMKGVAKNIENKRFDMAKISDQVGYIFEGFDMSTQSLETSLEAQVKFLEGLRANTENTKEFKGVIEEKIEQLKKEKGNPPEAEQGQADYFIQQLNFFATNLGVLSGQLDASQKRLEIRIDGAQKLAMSMQTSRPIFKTLLSSAVIEQTSQQALEAGHAAMQGVASAIDNLTTNLTDKTIESSRLIEEISSKPILDVENFKNNVKKLTNHFQEIEQFRLQTARTAERQRVDFENTTKQIEGIKTLLPEAKEEILKLNS